MRRLLLTGLLLVFAAVSRSGRDAAAGLRLAAPGHGHPHRRRQGCRSRSRRWPAGHRARAAARECRGHRALRRHHRGGTRARRHRGDKRGQALARIQSREAMRLGAELAAARGDYRVARAQAERDRKLQAEGIIPGQPCTGGQWRAAMPRRRA